MNADDANLVRGVLLKDFRSIARVISLCENGSPRASRLRSILFKSTGRAHVVGVTGAPGAGKSTLVDQLAREWHQRGLTVGVLAIDPSSPFSGGAILGDRIRMSRSEEQDRIFIRSMATRGALGGISRSTVDAVQVLDAAGFDLILIETVGVGQAEVDIVRTADTCMVVLVPGMGDSVQSIKAGILEIADIFVVNKADREGVDLLERDLRTMLSLVDRPEAAWRPEIARCIATEGKGIDMAIRAVERHYSWLKSSPEGNARRLQIMQDTLVKIACERARERAMANPKALTRLATECLQKRLDPHRAAGRLLDL